MSQLSNSGIVRTGVDGRSSQIITTIIPSGQSFPVLAAGDEFYLPLATGTVSIKPNTGSENLYTQGTGLSVKENPFNQLQVKNSNAFNVIISIFVGFGNYIDNRAILYNPLVANIVLPTWPAPNVATNLPINDISGNAFIDANGVNRLALTRVSIYISNLDLATAYTLKDSTGTMGVVTVQPQTEIVFPVNGNFLLSVPAGNVNAIVSEIYQAVLPTLT